MDGEEELNNEEQEMKSMVEPLNTLSFHERMKRLLLHFLLL